MNLEIHMGHITYAHYIPPLYDKLGREKCHITGVIVIVWRHIQLEGMVKVEQAQ